ncbi:SRPBCC family protein [Hydrogenophaga sp.]|uniref:SRPBCC family protein n=1 Tax=Hydrogenophaga sp. TaxID=1904254 RepID=UPI00271CBD66|nr:SRPBCC family protein [Hydrogenophaga sp.]MDO8906493.1 SRPBCC family protein [Hydrogenophaga sp.]
MPSSTPTPSTTSTVSLHRVFCAPPERVYRAFLEPDAMAKWLPPHGFVVKVLELNAHVGGSYRMQFTNMSNGHTHAFGGEYLELVPGERIVNTDRFDDPNLPGEMRTTVTFKSVSVGTAMTVHQEGLPALIPAEACYVGWQQSLQLLGLLVEAEIPG